MTIDEVLRIENDGKVSLLYSHDNGFTRHCVDIEGGSETYTYNEYKCFSRGTHIQMLRLHGYR